MMRLFYLPECDYQVGCAVTLPPPLQHHLAHVLRLAAGTRIRLCDGQGLVAQALLADQKRAEIEKVNRYPAPDCQLTLIQGVPKGDKLDLILQKGTELGINRFVLVTLQQSVGRLKEERRQKQLQRWQRIVQEAARQSGQFYLPEVEVAVTFNDALQAAAGECRLLLWEKGSQSLSQQLPPKRPASMTVVVGPEGGISPAEVERAECCGFVPVKLGPRILRTETAGLAIIAILQYLYGDLGCANDVQGKG
jgi:16S rRNA (uracil1498-N3)-methyltransferase